MTDCTSAVTTMPSATARMAWADSTATRSPASPASRRAKASTPAAASLAPGVQDRRDRHREQELNEERADAPHPADDPEHDAHEIGSDAGGEVLRSRRRDPLPLPGDLLADQGQTPHQSGRSRHRELGERPRPGHDDLAVLDHGHDAHGDRRHDDHEHRHAS